MPEFKISQRPCDDEGVFELCERCSRFSDKDRQLLSAAVLMMHHLFDKNPCFYEFDFRFNKKQ